MSFYEWSTTAATNRTGVTDVDWTAGTLAANLIDNNVIEMMSQIAEWAKDIGASQTSGGTVSAVTLATNGTIDANRDGLLLGFISGNIPTDGATLNVDTIGAKALVGPFGRDIREGEITTNNAYLVAYDASADGGSGGWKVLNPTISDQGFVSARACGAVGDNTTDDLTAIQNALDTTRNVYLEPGTYYITDALATTATDQRIVGAGVGETIISVKSGFSGDADGVINLAHWYTTVENLTIQFDQSAATNRASLEGYPPAIYSDGKAHCRVRDVRILRGETGVYCTGNTGGWVLERVDTGCFTYGIRIVGGALGKVLINQCHHWPWGISGDATLDAIYDDGDTVAWEIGRVDALMMTDNLTFGAKVNIIATAGQGPFGFISGLALDGQRAPFTMSAGQLQISNVYANKGSGADEYFFKVENNTTRLLVSNYYFQASSLYTVPFVYVTEGGMATFSDGHVTPSSNDNTIFEVDNGRLQINNTEFNNGDAVRSNPLIAQSSFGILQVTDNRCSVLTDGSGTFVECGSDRYHTIVGNHTGGLAIVKPAVCTLSMFGPNFVDKAEANYVRFDNRLKIGPHNDSLAGGAMVLEGADTNDDVTIDNLSGVARIVTAAGMGLQIVNGTDTLQFPFPEATATNIANVGNAINTTGKFAGKYVWDTTNNRLVRARAGDANSPWDVVDGSAAVTPA